MNLTPKQERKTHLLPYDIGARLAKDLKITFREAGVPDSPELRSILDLYSSGVNACLTSSDGPHYAASELLPLGSKFVQAAADYIDTLSEDTNEADAASIHGWALVCFGSLRHIAHAELLEVARPYIEDER